MYVEPKGSEVLQSVLSMRSMLAKLFSTGDWRFALMPFQLDCRFVSLVLTSFFLKGSQHLESKQLVHLFTHSNNPHEMYMILITQVRPGQFKLHREAARRLWKLCSKHCSITSILHFAGQLLHISWRVDLRAIADTFPGVGGCSVACVLGDVNARRWQRICHGSRTNQEKQEVLLQKVANKLVCVGNQMLRFFYLPGSCDVNCRVSTVRRGAQRPIWICTARNLRRSG